MIIWQSVLNRAVNEPALFLGKSNHETGILTIFLKVSTLNLFVIFYPITKKIDVCKPVPINDATPRIKNYMHKKFALDCYAP